MWVPVPKERLRPRLMLQIRVSLKDFSDGAAFGAGSAALDPSVAVYMTGGSLEVQPIWMSSFAAGSAVTVMQADGQRMISVGIAGLS